MQQTFWLKAVNPKEDGVDQKRPCNLWWLNAQKVTYVKKLVFNPCQPHDLKIWGRGLTTYVPFKNVLLILMDARAYAR